MAFIQCQIYSKALVRNTSVNVIYPDHVPEGTPVKVLYLLHGYMGHYMDWVRLTAIERYIRDYPVCVVMPSGYNHFYTNGPFGNNYFDAIFSDLPETIEAMFHVSKNKEDRYIAGLSMGGYGALKLALTPPYQYHKVASLSGVIDIDALYNNAANADYHTKFNQVFKTLPVAGTNDDLYHLFKQANDVKKVPDLFLACGTDDHLLRHHTDLKNFLNQEKITYKLFETPGGHEWRLWDLYIQEVIRWMFGEKKK